MEYALLNKDKSIAVITPFVNQKQLIENAIKQNKLSNLVCGTVHAFQGDEKDVVLFSTAISERTSSGTYNWLKNNKELIMLRHPEQGEAGAPHKWKRTGKTACGTS